MIERMRRYSFVLYHLEYESFLAKLQELGVLHIERNKTVDSPELRKNQELINLYSEALSFVGKIEAATDAAVSSPLPPKALLNKLSKAREEHEQLKRTADQYRKQIHDLEPWGHFAYELVSKLEEAGLTISFNTCLKNHFRDEWLEQYTVLPISERAGLVYFVVITKGEKPHLEADTFSFHHHSLKEFEAKLKQTEEEIKAIDEFYSVHQKIMTELFEKELLSLSQTYEYEEALQLADDEANDHVKVLSGWIPVSLEDQLVSYLKTTTAIYFAKDGTIEDNPPIKLRNNWFSKLYESISKMYMLPFYNEFDLTPFFAPFFMLFFGFCNADMAYGIVIVLFALFLKKKSKGDTMRVFMNLVITFGIASFVMGLLFGSILGYKTGGIPGLNRFVIVASDNDIFNLALLVGAIQILFGILINTIKNISQSGFKYGLAPFGNFLFILGLAILGSTQLGVEPTAIHAMAKYPIYIGLALIMLFNNPKKNIIINILGGIWTLYNVVTGFFGDILSYIRLFALGVSSAILGFVVNSIGQTILGDKPSIISYIIFPIFMIFGHTLNLALGALGGFVHPMRLTFVEFFKNAGFNGPGIAYKPFGNQNK